MNEKNVFPKDALFNLTVVTDGDDNQDRFVELCQCSTCTTKYDEKVHRGITIGGDADAGVEFVLEYIKTHNLNVRRITHSLIHFTLTHLLTHWLTHLLTHSSTYSFPFAGKIAYNWTW